MALFFPSDLSTCGNSTWYTFEALALHHWRMSVSMPCRVRASAYVLEEEASILTSQMRSMSSIYRLLRLGNPGGLYSAFMSFVAIRNNDSGSFVPGAVVITNVSSVQSASSAFCYLIQ
jgi:hypothetical protein